MKRISKKMQKVKAIQDRNRAVESAKKEQRDFYDGYGCLGMARRNRRIAAEVAALNASIDAAVSGEKHIALGARRSA